MIETSDQPQPVVPAATVVLARDGEQGLEVLLVQRSSAVKHMGGMWVFPGGKVDADDYAEAEDDHAAALAAAIRETREEAGLMLSREQLHYLSHWTTPEGAKKRFATWFFLAVLDDDQEVEVDGGEIAYHRWFRPAQAFAEMADTDNPFRLMPPTYVSLLELAPFGDCAEACAALARQPALIYAPRMVLLDDGVCFLYAGDAGYDDLSESAPGARHRTYMIDGQLRYLREL